MSAPEHASQISNNYTKNEKRDTDTTFTKKESVNSLLTVNTSFSNNFLDLDDEVTAVLGIRVPVSVYNYYRTELSGREQRLVREVLKQVFVNLVLGRVDVSGVENKPVLNININVQQVVEAEKKDENIVKLKRELDKLREELARATAENVELKNELEKMRKRCDELQHQLQRSSTRVQQHNAGVSKLLEDAVFALAVVAECLEAECSKQKLLEFIKREYEKLLQHATPPKKEIVGVYVKHLKE